MLGIFPRGARGPKSLRVVGFKCENNTVVGICRASFVGFHPIAYLLDDAVAPCFNVEEQVVPSTKDVMEGLAGRFHCLDEIQHALHLDNAIELAHESTATPGNARQGHAYQGWSGGSLLHDAPGGGYFESTRLELVREGFEDHEYFTLLGRQPQSAARDALLGLSSSSASRSGASCHSDTSGLLQARNLPFSGGPEKVQTFSRQVHSLTGKIKIHVGTQKEHR